MPEKLMVKHVRFTFDEWDRSIQKKRLYQSEDGNIRLGLIEIEKVKTPQVWDAFGKKITVADDGYKWLIISPVNEEYVITMYMNEKMIPILWYIDMCDGRGMDEDGVYYYEDLFLDLLVSESKEIAELDRDELEQAYAEGIIDDRQKRLAVVTAEALKEKIYRDPDWIRSFSMEMLEVMKNKMAAGKISGKNGAGNYKPV
ncbi:MAG: DUF402 domain-containing protein [Lachnospiraceae bacterium]|nr:DUF402 domain-containing protein [Lachnospiraceae bacterium]